VRLLLDQNLSPHLVRRLADVHPDSVHVRAVGLAEADDLAIWEYAQAHGLTIVTKDDDFRQRSFLFGAPPKVLWLRLGNCTTADVERAIRDSAPLIARFAADDAAALLVVTR